MKFSINKLAAVLFTAALVVVGCNKDYEADIDQLNEQINKIQNGSGEGTIPGLQTQVDALSQIVESYNNQLKADLEANYADQQAKYNELLGKYNDLNNALTTAKADLQNAINDIAAMKATETEINNRLTDAINDYNTKIAQATADFNAALGAQKTELLQTLNDRITAEIAALKDGDIAELKARVSTLETNYAALSTALQEYKNTVNATLAQMETRLQAAENAINNLNTVVIPAMQANIAAAQQAINANTTEIGKLKEWKAATDATIANMQAAIQNLADTKLDKQTFNDWTAWAIATFATKDEVNALQALFEDYVEEANARMDALEAQDLVLQQNIDQLRADMEEADAAINAKLEAAIAALNEVSGADPAEVELAAALTAAFAKIRAEMLAQYNELAQAIADEAQTREEWDEAIIGWINDLIDQLNTIFADIYGTFDSSIAALYAKAGLTEEEINALPDEAWDLATALEAAFDAFDAKLDDAKAELYQKIDDVKAELDQKIDDMDAAYKAADEALQGQIDVVVGRLDILEPAVTTLEGRMDAAEQDIIDLNDDLNQAIANLTQLIDDKTAQALTDAKAYSDEKLAEAKQYTDDQIAAAKTYVEALIQAVDDKVEALKGEVATLKVDVKDLLSRVQSIVFIPEYVDGNASINYVKSGAEYVPVESVLRYRVHPTEIAQGIKAAFDANDLNIEFLLADVKTRALNIEELEIKDVQAVANEILVTVLPKNLDPLFFTDPAQDYLFSAALHLTNAASAGASTDNKGDDYTTAYTGCVPGEETAIEIVPGKVYTFDDSGVGTEVDDAAQDFELPYNSTEIKTPYANAGIGYQINGAGDVYSYEKIVEMGYAITAVDPAFVVTDPIDKNMTACVAGNNPDWILAEENENGYIDVKMKPGEIFSNLKKDVDAVVTVEYTFNYYDNLGNPQVLVVDGTVTITKPIIELALHATVTWTYALDADVDNERYYQELAPTLFYSRADVELSALKKTEAGEYEKDDQDKLIDYAVDQVLDGTDAILGIVPDDFNGKAFAEDSYKDVLDAVPAADYLIEVAAGVFDIDLNTTGDVAHEFNWKEGDEANQYTMEGKFILDAVQVNTTVIIDFVDRFRDVMIIAGEDYPGDATIKTAELNKFTFKLLGGTDETVDGTYYDGVPDGSYQGESPELLETMYNAYIEKGIFTAADFATADDAIAAGGEFKTYKGADTTEPDFKVAGVRGKFKMKTYGHGVTEAWAQDQFTSAKLKSKAQTYFPDEYIIRTFKTYCGQVIEYIWSVDVEFPSNYNFKHVDLTTRTDDEGRYTNVSGSYDTYDNLTNFSVNNVQMLSVMSVVDENDAVIDPADFAALHILATWNLTEFSGDDHAGIVFAGGMNTNDAILEYNGRDEWARIMADLAVVSGTTPFEMPTRFDAGEEYENGLRLLKFSPFVAETETITLSLVNDYAFDIHLHQIYNINLLKGVKLYDKRGKVVYDGQNYVDALDPGFTHAPDEDFAVDANIAYNIDLATALNVTNVVCSTAELQALVDCPNPAEPWNWTFDYSSNVPLYDPTTIEFDATITTDWQILNFHFIVNVPVTVD